MGWFRNSYSFNVLSEQSVFFDFLFERTDFDTLSVSESFDAFSHSAESELFEILSESEIILKPKA